MTKCLITGCRFVDQQSGRHAWGDLHSVGEALVFNAILDEKGETAWTYDTPYSDLDKQVGVIEDVEFFERRGIIVWDKASGWTNDATKDYLLKWE